jgi:hypothetical protein
MRTYSDEWIPSKVNIPSGGRNTEQVLASVRPHPTEGGIWEYKTITGKAGVLSRNELHSVISREE